VRTVLESGRPIAQVAKDLGVGSESLRGWVRQAQADAGERTKQLTTLEGEDSLEIPATANVAARAT